MNKILFVVNVDWFFISHRLPIALAAINDGFEVHLACAITNKRDVLEGHGIIVHPLAFSRSGTGFLKELKTIKLLYNVVCAVAPEIIHTITIKPVLYGNIIARILSIPIRISSISGLGYIFIENNFKAKLMRSLISQLYKLSLTGSQKIIFQNKSDRNILRKICCISKNQELLIRGSGVDLNEYTVSPEPEGRPVVMMIARLLIDKGVNEFAEAASIIKAQRDDVRMCLVGDVDLENPNSVSTTQIQRWVDTGQLEHWGYSHNVVESISKSNVMVLPSYREGLPKSLIEAAACGRAVITTDVPGCRDAIEINSTGLLVPVKSSVALAKAILKLIDDGALRKKMAINGRALAEEAFDINDVINKHLSLYKNKEN